MADKQYLILLDVDARKRHRHRTEGGRITEFIVQLEIRTETGWKEVVRFDCAHNYAHKDCLDISGRQKKMSLYLDYEDALTLADDDINENWMTYRERFLKGVFPC